MIFTQNKTLLAVSAVVVAAGGLYFIFSAGRSAPPLPQQAGCKDDAKLCPDGSFVGRTGPSCQFTPCPEQDPLLETFTDESVGVTFSYPRILPAKYISTVDWPPKIQFQNEVFVCNEAGKENENAGKTEMRTINGRQYCRTISSEGAAGSVYNQYAYAFADDDGTIILNFSLRFVRCGNYDGTEKTACESERASFDIDSIVDGIAGSMKF